MRSYGEQLAHSDLGFYVIQIAYDIVMLRLIS